MVAPNTCTWLVRRVAGRLSDLFASWQKWRSLYKARELVTLLLPEDREFCWRRTLRLRSAHSGISNHPAPGELDNIEV